MTLWLIILLLLAALAVAVERAWFYWQRCQTLGAELRKQWTPDE